MKLLAALALVFAFQNQGTPADPVAALAGRWRSVDMPTAPGALPLGPQTFVVSANAGQVTVTFEQLPTATAIVYTPRSPYGLNQPALMVQTSPEHLYVIRGVGVGRVEVDAFDTVDSSAKGTVFSPLGLYVKAK